MHLPQLGEEVVVTSRVDTSVRKSSVLLSVVSPFSLDSVLRVVIEVQLVLDISVSVFIVASVSMLVCELFPVGASDNTEK